MVAILSRENFSSNDSLWSLSGNESGKGFVSSHRSQEKKTFEHRPLGILKGDLVSDSDTSAPEEAQPEIPQPLQEEQEILHEETLSFTEDQLKQQLVEAREEGEREASTRLKKDFESELHDLEKQQEEFFRLLAKSTNDGDQLISQCTSMAIKVGTLLARTELCLDQNVIESFIRRSIQSTGQPEAEIFSIRAAESWRVYASKIEAFIPKGVTLTFDKSLQAGDLIFAAGEGGYFDLLEERLSDIEDQLNSIDKSTLVDEQSNSLQNFIDSTFNSDDPREASVTEPQLAGVSEENEPVSEGQFESAFDDASSKEEMQNLEIPSQTDRMTLEGEGAISGASDSSAVKLIDGNEPQLDEESETGDEDN